MSRRDRRCLAGSALAAIVIAIALGRTREPSGSSDTADARAQLHSNLDRDLAPDSKSDPLASLARAPAPLHDESVAAPDRGQRQPIADRAAIAFEVRLRRASNAGDALVNLDVYRLRPLPLPSSQPSSEAGVAVQHVAHLVNPPGTHVATLAVVEGDWLIVSGTGLHARCAQLDADHLSGGFLSLPIEAARDVRGRVLDVEDGGAIPRACVTGFSRSSMLPPALLSLLHERSVLRDVTTWSRDDGTFELTPSFDDATELEVVAVGYCSTTCVDVVANGQPLAIALVPAIPASGRVLDEEGRPIAGAELTVGRIGAIPLDERVVARSDLHGAFSSSEFPRARDAVIARADGFAPTRVEVDLHAAPPADLELVLVRETPLRGLVVDESGAPIGGARLLVGSLTDHLVVGTMETDEDGGFAMPWTRRDHRYHVQVECDGFDVVDLGPVTVRDEPLRVELARRGAIDLQVRDDRGHAIERFRVARAPEVVVEAHDEFWWSQAEWIEVDDGGGRHRLEGLRRRPHRVLIEATGFTPAVVRAIPSAPAAGAAPLVVELARGDRFGGTLVDERGVPLAGALLRPMARASFGARRPLPVSAPATTDAAGEFSLLVDGDAPFDLVATRDGFAPATFDRIDPRVPHPTLRWPRCGAIAGHVRAPDRTLLASICLRIEDAEGGAFVEARPRPDGSFRFDHLPIGPTRIQLFDEWASTTWHTFAVRERRVDVEPDSTIEIDFDLTAQTIVEGLLELPPELASARFEVLARPSAATRSAEIVTSTVELDGRFVLCNLADGPWTLLARARSTGLVAFAQAEIEVVSAMPAPLVRLSVAEPSLAVQLIAAEDGRPLEHASLELDGAHLRLSVESGPGALVLCSGLDPAPGIRCVARAPGYARAAVDLTPSPTPIVVALAREARIALTLGAPAGFDWSGTRVTLEPASGPSITLLAAAELDFSELPAGPFRVHVRGPRTSARCAGYIAVGETRRLRLELAAPARLEVTIVDAHGAPSPRCAVTVHALALGEDSPPLRAVTDESGSASFEVAAGECVVTCGASTVRVVAASGAVLPLTLEAR